MWCVHSENYKFITLETFLLIKALCLYVYIQIYSLQEARAEFDEYQESSRELEAELEAQLEQAERRNNELETALQRLQEDNDSLRVSSHHYHSRCQLSDVIIVVKIGLSTK